MKEIHTEILNADACELDVFCDGFIQNVSCGHQYSVNVQANNLIQFVWVEISYENKCFKMNSSRPFSFCKSSSQRKKGWRPLPYPLLNHKMLQGSEVDDCQLSAQPYSHSHFTYMTCLS